MDREALESDARQDRMDRVAVLYSEITAATREFLRAVAESDRHRDWAEAGFASCVDWLAWRIGISRMTASEKVRAARALEDLPLISEAMGRGELSFSKVRALTRVATPENETELLAFARAGSTASLERLVRGRLTPEVAAVLMRAVEAAGDALYAATAPDVEVPDPEQRRADAVGLLAERALAVGFVGDDVPVSGSRAERYQVVLHVEPETLRAEGEPGMSELEDGTRFSAENSRRLACDASVVEVEKGPDGSVLDVGRRSRTVPPALRRALEARDRGCRFPGCGLRFTDAHHIEHWADGGETSLKNTVLLCRRHHRLVHEDGHRVFSDAEGQVVFFDPRGRAIAASPPPRGAAGDPVEALRRRNRERGVEPDWRSGLPTSKRDGAIPIEVVTAALRALDSGSAPTRPQEGAA